MKKQKDQDSKRKAFMSFLEAPTTQGISPEKIQKKANSDNEQYQEVYLDAQKCVVCQKQMNPDNKKKCGFCGSSACGEHLRKRRKKKNKWEKICDDCEDRYLYQTYMRLQIKAEQALQVEYQIVNLKHNEQEQLLRSRQEKRRDISFKSEDLNHQFQRKMEQLTSTQNKLMSKEHQIEGLQLQVKQLEQYVVRMQKMNKQNYEQDYKCLTLENQKIRKDLNSYGKRCEQIVKTIERKESELEQAYERWEQDQYRKSIIQEPKLPAKKKDKDCQIY